MGIQVNCDVERYARLTAFTQTHRQALTTCCCGHSTVLFSIGCCCFALFVCVCVCSFARKPTHHVLPFKLRMWFEPIHVDWKQTQLVVRIFLSLINICNHYYPSFISTISFLSASNS